MGPLAQAFCLPGIEMLFHRKKVLQGQSPELRVCVVESLQRLVDGVGIALRRANRQRQDLFRVGDVLLMLRRLFCEVFFQRIQQGLLRVAYGQLIVHPIVKVDLGAGCRILSAGVRVRMGMRVGMAIGTCGDFCCYERHSG